MGGYRSIWHTLQLEGIQVPKDVVEGIVRELDPEGCEERKAKRLKRRRLVSPGPNYSWHADGYDKLKPYGLRLFNPRANNFPEIPASFYLECVNKHNGCPEKMRIDNGTENGTIAVMQCYFRNLHGFLTSLV